MTLHHPCCVAARRQDSGERLRWPPAAHGESQVPAPPGTGFSPNFAIFDGIPVGIYSPGGA